jgi:hypothetical protein
MIGNEGLHSLQRRRGSSVSGIVFLNIPPAIVGRRCQFFVKRDHGPPAEGAESFDNTR